MPCVICLIHPGIAPAHDAALAQAKNLFDLDVRLGRLAEEVLPNRFTASLPAYSVPSGAGSVFSKTQSALISRIISATSYRLKA